MITGYRQSKKRFTKAGTIPIYSITPCAVYSEGGRGEGLQRVLQGQCLAEISVLYWVFSWGGGGGGDYIIYKCKNLATQNTIILWN